ncbi:MAG: cell wall biogenesis protein [Lentisphaerae bacterium GWF2_52_8]|nr:MAG: cell wall biogenesis protein [Lentisphaerae bacterium GWF2_52_8]
MLSRNVPFGRPMIGEEERRAVTEVMNDPILVHGPRAKQFEADFAKYAGAQHAISVSSCTAALHLTYFYLGMKPGDEVIVPAQTHTATAHAVELTGAKPVFVDAELKTGNIDIAQIEAAITPRTKAISVVHYLGLPVDMDRVNGIARKYNLFVVEDAALAVGTFYKGVHAGLLGDVGCFSFYPVKHITTAEGGLVLTKHAEMAARIERQKAFGVDRHAGERKVPGVYDVTMLGFNYRMNEIQAAIGIEQIKKIETFWKKRKENYEALEAELKKIDEIELFASSSEGYRSSYYCLSAILKDKLAPKRFEIVEVMKNSGVGTSVYYPKPVPHMSYYRQKYGYNESFCPKAARISYQSIALPVGPHLNTEDMAYVAATLKKAIQEAK